MAASTSTIAELKGAAALSTDELKAHSVLVEQLLGDAGSHDDVAAALAPLTEAVQAARKAIDTADEQPRVA